MVLKLHDESLNVLPSSDFSNIVYTNSTYMVTGGLADFGLACAKWLVEIGAKHLALMS